MHSLSATAHGSAEPPATTPTLNDASTSLARRECPVSSKGAVASPPAHARIAAGPPGWLARTDVTSYTTPRTMTQQSSARLWRAMSAAEWMALQLAEETTGCDDDINNKYSLA